MFIIYESVLRFNMKISPAMRLFIIQWFRAVGLSSGDKQRHWGPCFFFKAPFYPFREYPFKPWINPHWLLIFEQFAMKIEKDLMKMTMTMAMKMERRAMEMIFPTGSGRDSLDLHDLVAEMKSVIHLYVALNTKRFKRFA